VWLKGVWLKVLKSDKFKKSLKSKKLQKSHHEKIIRIIKILIEVENFQCLFRSSLAKLYKFEQLKHSKNWAFSFRLDNKKIRLIVRPNTITDYAFLKDEKEVLIYDISFDHYKDI
jgi:hypothetical protein